MAERVLLIIFVRNVFASRMRGVRVKVPTPWHWKSFARYKLYAIQEITRLRNTVC